MQYERELFIYDLLECIHKSQYSLVSAWANDIGRRTVHMKWIHTRSYNGCMPSMRCLRSNYTRLLFVVSLATNATPLRFVFFFRFWFTLQFVTRWEPKPLKHNSSTVRRRKSQLNWIRNISPYLLTDFWFVFFFFLFVNAQTKRPTNRINRQPKHGGDHT